MKTELHEQIGEDRVIIQTGRSTNHWIILLKRWGLGKKDHKEAAQYLQEEFDLSPWWSQMIVVRCEYHLGLRHPKPFPQMPRDIRKALIGKSLLDQFTHLAPSHRREYIDWIVDAKKPETRRKRIQKVIHNLKFKI